MSEECLGPGSETGRDAVKTGGGKGTLEREVAALSAARVQKTWT